MCKDKTSKSSAGKVGDMITWVSNTQNRSGNRNQRSKSRAGHMSATQPSPSCQKGAAIQPQQFASERRPCKYKLQQSNWRFTIAEQI